MSDKPKRRWHQFSLKALFVAVTLTAITFGVSIAWLSHRDLCLRKAAEYSRHQGIPYVSLPGLSMSREELDAEQAKWREDDQKRDKLYLSLEEAYRRAARRPWERLWIEDVLEDP